MTQVCKCGRGAVSAYDGKCGHCRTKKERKIYAHKHYNDLWPKEARNAPESIENVEGATPHPSIAYILSTT